jgi:hypothetical protein
MIKDKSAVPDPERRYAFMQAVGRVNDAGQWRAAEDVRYETETQSARPLHQPG